MTYTNLMLFALGFLGILLHNLIKINDLNKQANGKYSISAYIRIERFSIVISLIVVAICLLIKNEIKELEIAGKYLGLGFVTAGYMGQSIVVSFMGRASRKIEGVNDDKPKTDG